MDRDLASRQEARDLAAKAEAAMMGCCVPFPRTESIKS